MRTRAQIIFTQDTSDFFKMKWKGRLLNPDHAMDEQTKRPVTDTPRFDITEVKKGQYDVVMQGGSIHGRRYATYPSLNKAQEAGVKWAKRRFYIDEDAPRIRERLRRKERKR